MKLSRFSIGLMVDSLKYQIGVREIAIYRVEMGKHGILLGMHVVPKKDDFEDLPPLLEIAKDLLPSEAEQISSDLFELCEEYAGHYCKVTLEQHTPESFSKVVSKLTGEEL